MTNKELVTKQLELTFDFVKSIIDNPSIADQLPDKCEIDFIEKDFSSLKEIKQKNLKLIKVTNAFQVIENSRPTGLRKTALVKK